MGFWDPATEITAARLNAMGPIMQGIIGTNGEYQDIWAAMVDPGGPQWTKAFIVPGAIISRDTTLPTGDTHLIAMGFGVPITGNFVLTIAGDGSLFKGIRRTTTTGVGFNVTASRTKFDQCLAISNSSHGWHFNSAVGLHMMSNCISYGNGGDGVRIETVNDHAMITNLRSQANTGYGLNNVNNARVSAATSHFNGNTGGSWNGSSTYRSASCYAP